MPDYSTVPAPFNNSNGDSQQVMLAPRSRDRRPQTDSNRATSAVPSRRRHRRSLIIAAVLIVGAAGLYFHLKSANSGNKKAGPPPVTISAASATSGSIGVYVQALGTVTPVYTVSLTARVSGQITKVEYREAQLVHTGDPLIEIDPAPFEAAVTQAEGQLGRDQAQLELANINLVRDTDLLKKGVISKQEFDTQVATVHQFEGAVKLDQGNLESARVNLAYCHIVSPIDGRVGLRLVDPGNIVQANGTSPLVMITQLQPITVEFNVAEDYVPQIVRAVHGGKKLTVDAYDRANQHKLATGTLESFNSEIDVTTGTLRLRGTFENENDSLFPNQFVNARLLVDTHEGVTLLPNNAVQRNDNGPFVYLLQSNQTVEATPITVITTDGNQSEVQGIEPGAIVAADSFNRLNDGTRVALRSAGGNVAVRASSPNK